MTQPTTSPVTEEPVAARSVRANSAREEWLRFGVFLRRPVLPNSASGLGTHAARNVLRLYLLDVVLMTGLVTIAVVALAIGVEFPQNRLDALELTPWLIFAIIVGAPFTEEILFRSWLSGRPAHIVAAVLLGASIFVLAGFAASEASGAFPPQLIASAGLAIAGLIAAWILRHRPPMRWFAWAFPMIFWVAAALFGLVHMVNFEEANMLMLLPLVVPQFVAGLMFGYVRVQYGLWAAMLLHALHNGTAFGVMLLAGPMMGANWGAMTGVS